MNLKQIKKIAGATALFIPVLALAEGRLENPANNVTDSGIGVISGWHCSATRVEAVIDGQSAGFAYVGSERLDTYSICNKTNNGFSLLLNFNELSRGAHNIKMYANGVLFGESNFKTTQSGGTAFLTNKSKTVDVVDFPNPGSTATLTWSQSRQSFVVTNINTNINPPAPIINGLEKLYGKVTLNYRFNNNYYNYNDSFYFSAADYNYRTQTLVAPVDGKDKNVGCSIINQSSYEFLCLIAEPKGGRDAFIFNVSYSGSIYGKYEYCPASSSDSKCVSEILLSPDGVVNGNVVSPRAASVKSAGALSAAATASADTPESKEQLKALQLAHEAKEPSTESATPEQLDAVLEAFERLSQ